MGTVTHSHERMQGFSTHVLGQEWKGQTTEIETDFCPLNQEKVMGGTLLGEFMRRILQDPNTEYRHDDWTTHYGMLGIVMGVSMVLFACYATVSHRSTRRRKKNMDLAESILNFSSRGRPRKTQRYEMNERIGRSRASTR